MIDENRICAQDLTAAQERALSVLSPLGALTIDMQEAIRRTNAELLFADEGAVLLRHRCGVFMLWCKDKPSGERALDSLKDGREGVKADEANEANEADEAGELNGSAENLGMRLCVAHGEAAKEAILSKTKLKADEPCIQFCRFSKEKLPLRGLGSIRQLDMGDLEAVNAHYGMGDAEHNARAIREGLVYGIEIEGRLAGFIGMHFEGSVGMLEVFPEYRRMGLGTELESYMHNLHIDKGWIPYGQVYTDNAGSLQMQAKFGLTKSHEHILWTFPPDME